MADIKISALGAIASVAGEDLVAIVDDPSGTPASRKATIDQIKTYIGGITASSTDTLTNKSVSLTTNTLTGTSLELKTAISDETGSGALVFATSPTLVSPALGTPASGILSGCTVIPMAQASGILPDANMPNLTGDITTTEGAVATTIGADKVLLSMIAPAGKTECISMAVSDNTTDLATGTVFTFYMPYAMTLTDIKASVLTAPTGAGLIVDVHDAGTTIMTTDKLNIDVTEFHTKDAGTQPALTDTALANNAKIEIIIDQVGSTVAGAGLVVYLIGYQT